MASEDIEALRAAAVAAEASDAPDALDLARRWAQAAPDSAEAQRTLGSAALGEGMTEEAAIAFRAAVRLDPADTASVIALGHITHTTGRDADATEMLEQAANAAPEDVGLLRDLVIVHRMAGRSRKAIQWAEKLLSQQPKDPLTLLDNAELLLDLSEYHEARQMFARLRDADSEPGRAIHATHGMIESELRAGRLRSALDLAVEATSLDREQLTTDLLSFLIVQVFGEGDRRAKSREEIEAELAAERAAYRAELEVEVTV